MAQPLVEQLIREVLASHAAAEVRTYALVDCARDPEIYQALLEPALELRCLYSGDLPPVLAEAAPYIVEVAEGTAFASSFKEAWGGSWGILVRSTADIDTLRKHFKKIQVVRAPGGKRLLFRFYDPRVMRLFLPTCDEEQLQEIFSDKVRELVMEDREGGALSFRVERGRLVQQARGRQAQGGAEQAAP